MPRLPAIVTGLLLTFTSIVGCNRHPVENSIANPPETKPAVWLEEGLKFEGLTISLGYRDEKLQPGAWLEPIVTITKNGHAVSDAMVFNRLVSPDGQTTLGDEVATVYEPASGGQPACYARGKLWVPEEEPSAAVRFRIVLPETNEEWNRDISLPSMPGSADSR